MKKYFIRVLVSSAIVFGIVSLVNKIDYDTTPTMRSTFCYVYRTIHKKEIKEKEEKEHRDFIERNTLKIAIFYTTEHIDTLTLEPNADEDVPRMYINRYGVAYVHNAEDELVVETNAPVKVLHRPIDD